MESLVRSAQEGNEDALYTLLKSIEKKLYKKAFYMVGNTEDAFDVTQEALLKIVRHLPAYRSEASFEQWAQRILINTAIDHLRQRRTEVDLEMVEHVMMSPKEHVEAQVIFRETARELVQAIASLPDLYRVPLMLRYQEELNYQEIAATLDLPVNTVKSHVFRARNMLKALIQHGHEGGEET